MAHIALIGNGISGVTAARHIRKRSDDRITLISAETEHFFSRTALMYVFMGHMEYKHIKPYEDHFWEKNRIDLKFDRVTDINYTENILIFQSGDSMTYDSLVLAVGSKPNKFGWPGEDLPQVQGLYSWQDLELMEKNAKGTSRAVIVGGGLIGVEMAEMFRSRNIDVTFLVREDRFWGGVLPAEEADLVGRHIQEHHVDLRYKTELDEILADARGNVCAVRTKRGEEIACEFVGLTAGVTPNVDFLKNNSLEINRGILVDEFCRTNIPNVYAIGDCAERRNPISGRKALEQVWYTGKMMGEAVAQTLTGTPTEYKPGHWFNSAKFFDIEYQTYGWVGSSLGENESQYYWEHPDGRKCLKIVFEADTRELIGVNAFGIRLRHVVLDQMLEGGKTVDYLLEHWRDALFDPEFYTDYIDGILSQFNQTFQTNLKPRKKNWSRIFNAQKAWS